MRDEQPYNPLDKRNIGKSVAEELLTRPIEPMPLAASFMGAGIYSIYYTGKHQPYPPYEAIAERNSEGFHLPIYVGKAVPSGSRKGLETTEGPVLSKRLREHSDSLKQATNLDIRDFHCQYLVVDDIWIPFGESLLIQRFSPLWNQYLDGFGNHNPGKGRQEQQKSPWDTVHPGRAWSDKLQPNTRPLEHWLKLIERYVRDLEPPETRPEVPLL